MLSLALGNHFTHMVHRYKHRQKERERKKSSSRYNKIFLKFMYAEFKVSWM